MTPIEQAADTAASLEITLYRLLEAPTDEDIDIAFAINVMLSFFEIFGLAAFVREREEFRETYMRVGSDFGCDYSPYVWN